MKKYVKIIGADGYDTILCDGDVVFVGTSLAVSSWIASKGVFISDVIGG